MGKTGVLEDRISTSTEKYAAVQRLVMAKVFSFSHRSIPDGFEPERTLKDLYMNDTSCGCLAAVIADALDIGIAHLTFNEQTTFIDVLNQAWKGSIHASFTDIFTDGAGKTGEELYTAIAQKAELEFGVFVPRQSAADMIQKDKVVEFIFAERPMSATVIGPMPTAAQRALRGEVREFGSR